MKKLLTGLIFGLLLVGMGSGQSLAAVFVSGDNEVFFRNYETAFAGTAGDRLVVTGFNTDGTPIYTTVAYGVGDRLTPGTLLTTGDTFVGIIDVQNISHEGEPNHFDSSSTNQLTGVFAQQITAIDYPDPYDAAQTTFPHITLGASSMTSFTFGAQTLNIAPYLDVANGEMFAFYLQQGAGTTQFESNGTLQDDVNKATDGDLYFTLGDDGGFAYSHAALGTTVSNFTGESWAALNLIVNNTGWLFVDINDPNELELGDNPLILTAAYLSSELEGNPNGTLFGKTSPWDYRSEDPAHVHPVPEPSTIVLLGAGLIGIYALRRRHQS